MCDVVIMNIMRYELPVPSQAAGCGVQGNKRIGIQIDTGASVVINVGCGIPSRYIEQPLPLVESHGCPKISAAVFAGCRIWPPCRCAGLTVARNDVESPGLLAVPDPECTDPTFRSRFRPRRPDIDEVAVNQRGHADEIAVLRLGDLLGPQLVTVFCIERYQKSISGAADDSPC